MPAFEQEAWSIVDATRPAEISRGEAVTAGPPSPVPTSLGTEESGRHTAVLLFTDVVDSTRLTEELGDDGYLALSQELDGRVRASIWEHGGRTEDGIRPGDGLLAAFASGEDAVHSADLAHGHAASLGLRLHVGIHIGDVIRSRTGVHGAAVNMAARICALAPPGTTVVSAAVRSVVGPKLAATLEDFGCHQLKGISEPQVLFVTPGATATA